MERGGEARELRDVHRAMNGIDIENVRDAYNSYTASDIQGSVEKARGSVHAPGRLPVVFPSVTSRWPAMIGLHEDIPGTIATSSVNRQPKKAGHEAIASQLCGECRCKPATARRK